MSPANFGWAIEQLKAGNRVCRAGWNGKGMWLALVGNWDGDLHSTNIRASDAECERIEQELDGVQHAAFIAMKTAQNTFIPWLASQADMLAEDWELVA